MSNNQHPSDEIDLGYLFNAVGKSYRNTVRLGFSALDFLLKYWYIALILIVGGAAGGYFWQQSEARGKTAKVLVRVNFDGAGYLYQTVELMQKKIDQSDKSFMEAVGLDMEDPELVSIAVTPVVRMQDIVSRFEDSNRSLESVLKNVEFEEDDEFALYKTFDTDYRYHNLEVGFKAHGKEQIISALLAYINNNPAIEQMREMSVNNLQDQLRSKQQTVMQIDTLIKELRDATKKQTSGSGTLIVEKDDDFDQLIRSKVEIQNEIKLLREELILTEQTVVPMSNLAVYPSDRSFFERRMIMLPAVLFGGFCLLAFFRFMYVRLRRIADAPEQ